MLQHTSDETDEADETVASWDRLIDAAGWGAYFWVAIVAVGIATVMLVGDVGVRWAARGVGLNWVGVLAAEMAWGGAFGFTLARASQSGRRQ